MSAGRRCRRCGAWAVHRAQRRRWQRWSAWVVPLRPQHCLDCNAKSWGLLHADEGTKQYVVAAALWLLILSAVVRPVIETPRRPPVVAVATAQPHVPATPAPEQAAPTVVPAPTASAAVPTAPPDQETVRVDAAGRAMQLDAIDVRWTGEAMEVIVRSDGELVHSLRVDDNVQGYVLDLPGRWQLPPTLRMNRSFSRSNLQRLRVGRHDAFLRLVFSLRDPARPPPVIETVDDGLRVLVR